MMGNGQDELNNRMDDYMAAFTRQESGGGSGTKPPDPPEPPLREFTLTGIPSLIEHPPKVSWLIQDYLPAGNVALLFGDAEAGKSMVLIDWACRVSLGLDWNGKKTKPGPVVYIAGEGHAGLPGRFKAWEKRFDKKLGDNLYLSNIGAEFLSGESLAQVQTAVLGLPEPPSLIIIDTLAANFGPGNENDTQDMVGFLNAIRHLHEACEGSSILIAHHPGHGDKTRARGAYALKGALDTEYRLENKDGLRELSCTKSKDFEPPYHTFFELESISLSWVDDYGNPISAPVLVVTEPPEVETKLKPMQLRFLHLLDEFTKSRRSFVPGNLLKGCPHPPKAGQLAVAYEDFKKFVRQQGGISTGTGLDSNRKAMQRVRQQLQDLDIVMVWEEWIYRKELDRDSRDRRDI